MTMKCEHGVVSALILRDRGWSYIQLGCASLISMLLCVENLAGHEYICYALWREACEFSLPGFSAPRVVMGNVSSCVKPECSCLRMVMLQPGLLCSGIWRTEGSHVLAWLLN